MPTQSFYFLNYEVAALVPSAGPLLTSFLCALAALTALLYWYSVSTFHYWKDKRVPHDPPVAFFGNIKDIILMRTSYCKVHQDIYRRYADAPYVGVYLSRQPGLLVRDLDLAKTILVKDFLHFTDRGFLTHPEKNPLQQHLFSLGGRKWRTLRTKLSPTFTSGKMKGMFPMMETCAENLVAHLSDAAAGERVLEMKEVVAKFTTDVIGTCAFGLQMNALDDPDSEFRRMGRKIFEPSATRNLALFTNVIMQDIGRILKLDDLGAGLSEFFIRTVKETVDYRRENNVSRNDFMQLLINLKYKGKVDDDAENNEEVQKEEGVGLEKIKDEDFVLDDGLMAAQAFVFFFAGFETSSTAMSFALHELAVHPDVQARLRDEVDEAAARGGGRLSYDAVMGMKYLDQVVSETLRLYPPVPFLRRAVTTSYTVPGTSLQLDKDVVILIPTYAIQRDAKYFPDPERFDPERFTEEEKAKRHNFAYLPFGDGPRNCIGMRFGLLQTKLGLASLLAKYEFHVCEGTEIPVRLNPKSIVTSSTAGTIVRITRRS